MKYLPGIYTVNYISSALLPNCLQFPNLVRESGKQQALPVDLQPFAVSNRATRAPKVHVYHFYLYRRILGKSGPQRNPSGE
jgi:hypothetical protein